MTRRALENVLDVLPEDWPNIVEPYIPDDERTQMDEDGSEITNVEFCGIVGPENPDEDVRVQVEVTVDNEYTFFVEIPSSEFEPAA